MFDEILTSINNKIIIYMICIKIYNKAFRSTRLFYSYIQRQDCFHKFNFYLAIKGGGDTDIVVS